MKRYQIIDLLNIVANQTFSTKNNFVEFPMILVLLKKTKDCCTPGRALYCFQKLLETW